MAPILNAFVEGSKDVARKVLRKAPKKLYFQVRLVSIKQSIQYGNAESWLYLLISLSLVYATSMYQYHVTILSWLYSAERIFYKYFST